MHLACPSRLSRPRLKQLEAVCRRAQGMLEMHRRYGVARAFVCTDDPSIIRQVRCAQLGLSARWLRWVWSLDAPWRVDAA